MEGEKMRAMRMFFWEYIDHEDTKASWLSYILLTLIIVNSPIKSV